MENKIGYAMITINEYRELVLKEKELELVIDDCETQISKLKERYGRIEEFVLNKLYKDNSWSISHLEFEDGEIKKEYYFRELFDEFMKVGITDAMFIEEKIIEFNKRYEEEHKEERVDE